MIAQATEIADRDAAAVSPSFVFVAGCGHSGTTLMATILGCHSAIYAVPNETAVFFGEQTPAEVCAFLRGLRDRHRPGKPVICEKTPPHVRRIPRIFSSFPDARLILMLRDGRDVVASLKRQGEPVAQAIDRWVVDTTLTLAALDDSRVRAVRYEALVSVPQATVKSVCAFLGVAFEEWMLRFHEQAPNWFGVATLRPGDEHSHERRVRRNWQMHQPLFDDRGRWRGELDERDLALFDRAACKLVGQLDDAM